MPASNRESSTSHDLFGDGAPASSATELSGFSDLSEALQVCRKLRSKFAFLPLVNADNEPVFWQTGDSSTAVYWCLRTMECAGPDGGLAHASTCRADRDCYACHDSNS